MSEHYIRPDWPVSEKVRAVVSTRGGGVSATPYDSFNLGDHVGDELENVRQNRSRLKKELALTHEPQWLEQYHGTEVVAAVAGGPPLRADAVCTDQPGLPCAVLTADCLPVFFCDGAGTQVAVAHAGWRGLAAGILENTLSAFEQSPAQISVWLGPAISQAHFEVGEEVKTAFAETEGEARQAFTPSQRKGRWMADLYQLARYRLMRSGVTCISGGNFCTYGESERFFSFRRDGQTGRMASLIWLA